MKNLPENCRIFYGDKVFRENLKENLNRLPAEQLLTIKKAKETLKKEGI